jgi:uncharacterized protein (TIRG00374 family)
MIEPAASSNAQTRDIWKIVPGILISLTAVVILAFVVDWQEFVKAISQANYFYLWASLPIYLVSYLVRARAWQVILMKVPTLKQVFLAQQSGYFLNNILPLRLGELGRSYFLGRKELGFWRVFSTIFVERAFDLLLAVGLLLSTLPFVVSFSGALQIAQIVGLIVLIGLAVMFILANQQDKVLQLFEKYAARWPRFVQVVSDRLKSFLSGLSALSDIAHFLEAFAWMAFSWLLAIIVNFLVLRAYMPDAQVLWAAFSLSVVALGMGIPSSPGQIGVYEGAYVYALSFFGVAPSLAFAFALTSHVMNYLVTGLFGIYALAKEGHSLGDIFDQLRQRRSKTNQQ